MKQKGGASVIISSMKLAPFFLASLVSVASLSVACGGSVEHAQTAGTSKAPIAANGHGALKVMGEALGEVALRPEQRTEIEKLAADAEARHAPLLGGRKELMLAFADQVEKGAIDRAALQPKVDKVTGDFAQSRTADRAAIVKLHDLLDKQQRNDFVDALEDRVKGKRGRQAFAGEGDHGRPGFGQLHKLADELKLTDEQKDKIKDTLKEARKESHKGGHHERGAKHGGGHHEKMKAGKHALEAFREDKLDLERVPEGKGLAGDGLERISKVAAEILPILTPEQRQIAADKLRELANRGDSSLLVH